MTIIDRINNILYCMGVFAVTGFFATMIIWAAMSFAFLEVLPFDFRFWMMLRLIMFLAIACGAILGATLE